MHGSHLKKPKMKNRSRKYQQRHFKAIALCLYITEKKVKHKILNLI